MNKYKVCVYAICKNEEKFCAAWTKSMGEADEIFVLDTGSTDNTVKLLRENGVNVSSKIISPWRFDTARNLSLQLLPKDTDICVCTDLDEQFESGWREMIEKAWRDGVRQLRYRYTWNFKDDGSEGYVFWIDKIHSRNGFKWVNSVHEVLKYEGAEPLATAYAEGVQLNHHADPEKSRLQYLPLLELSVKEDPQNDRNMHYLGREYMYYGMWDKCIETLKRHLSMPSAVWQDERAASMRYIAKAYDALGDRANARKYHLLSLAEAPHLREPWLDFALFEERSDNHHAVIALALEALKITERPRTYISEAESWGSLPYDLLSVAYFYTGNKIEACKAIDKALELNPTDKRLFENRKIIFEGK